QCASFFISTPVLSWLPQERQMGFSLWHWAIVVAIAAIVFWRQIPSLILHITDPGLAFRYRFGLLGAEDREAMVRRQERGRLEIRQKAWFLIVAVLALVYALKALSVPDQASADVCSTQSGTFEVTPAPVGSPCIGPTGLSGVIVRGAESAK